MDFLIDTHALLWWDAEPERIGKAAIAIFREKSNTLLVSHASAWEMAIKLRLGKLRLPVDLGSWLKKSIIGNGFSLRPISLGAILTTQELPMHHSDPFDRLLIAEAMSLGCPAISSDSQWDNYPIQRIWD
jgi:PIN domain nuclease of toxin-antitoxin system